MKIMTYNTYHCENFKEKKIDFQLMARILKESGAEVIGLNEVRGKGPDPEYDAQLEILSNLTGIENSYFAKAFDVAGESLRKLLDPASAHK